MFASLLGATTQLEKLILIIPEHGTEKYSEALLHTDVNLPSVRTLITGASCGPIIIPLCPEITSINISSSFNLDPPAVDDRGKTFLTKMMGYLKISSGGGETQSSSGRNGFSGLMQAARAAERLRWFGIATCLSLVRAEGM